MDGKVEHRLLQLIHQKEEKLGRRLPVREIANGTGVSQKLIYRWLDPEKRVTRYDEKTITAFCHYFECDISDLLVYEPENDV